MIRARGRAAPCLSEQGVTAGAAVMRAAGARGTVWDGGMVSLGDAGMCACWNDLSTAELACHANARTRRHALRLCVSHVRGLASASASAARACVLEEVVRVLGVIRPRAVLVLREVRESAGASHGVCETLRVRQTQAARAAARTSLRAKPRAPQSPRTRTARSGAYDELNCTWRSRRARVRQARGSPQISGPVTPVAVALRTHDVKAARRRRQP